MGRPVAPAAADGAARPHGRARAAGSGGGAAGGAPGTVPVLAESRFPPSRPSVLGVCAGSGYPHNFPMTPDSVPPVRTNPRPSSARHEGQMSTTGDNSQDWPLGSHGLAPRAGGAGAPAIDPEVLLCLWLNAPSKAGTHARSDFRGLREVVWVRQKPADARGEGFEGNNGGSERPSGRTPTPGPLPTPELAVCARSWAAGGSSTPSGPSERPTQLPEAPTCSRRTDPHLSAFSVGLLPPRTSGEPDRPRSPYVRSSGLPQHAFH